MRNNKKKYFIQQFLHVQYQHGGIGGVDAEKILLSNGFTPIFLPGHKSFSFFAKFFRFFSTLRIFNSIPDGSVVVVLFPIYARMNRLLIKWLARKKAINCVCLLMDIDGIKDGEEQTLIREKVSLQQFQHILVHNESMKQWVINNISPSVKISILEFFDFLATPVSTARTKTDEIVFAGNLEKSGFLKNLPLILTAQKSLNINLYGPGMFEMDESFERIKYFGSFDPADLPAIVKGSFGLLWDGDSVERPSGSLGLYMQYITHHKVSLYILAGLPIIAPVTAGSASLIKKYQIGILIESLFDIESAIERITPEEYQEMKDNIKQLALKISNGGGLQSMINEIIIMS